MKKIINIIIELIFILIGIVLIITLYFKENLMEKLIFALIYTFFSLGISFILFTIWLFFQNESKLSSFNIIRNKIREKRLTENKKNYDEGIKFYDKN